MGSFGVFCLRGFGMGCLYVGAVLFGFRHTMGSKRWGGVDLRKAMVGKGLLSLVFCDEGSVIGEGAGGVVHFDVEVGEAGAEMVVGAEARVAMANPRAMGARAAERSFAKAPIQLALFPPIPRNEPMIPKMVARPSSPQAISRCTRTADRSAACCAAISRQFMKNWTPAGMGLFQASADWQSAAGCHPRARSRHWLVPRSWMAGKNGRRAEYRGVAK
jgi:hypothetical protein